jgi:hypothetical protein
MPPESGSPKSEAPVEAAKKDAVKSEVSTPVGKSAGKNEPDDVPASRGLGGQYKMVGGKRVRVTE